MQGVSFAELQEVANSAAEKERDANRRKLASLEFAVGRPDGLEMPGPLVFLGARGHQSAARIVVHEGVLTVSSLDGSSYGDSRAGALRTIALRAIFSIRVTMNDERVELWGPVLPPIVLGFRGKGADHFIAALLNIIGRDSDGQRVAAVRIPPSKQRIHTAAEAFAQLSMRSFLGTVAKEFFLESLGATDWFGVVSVTLDQSVVAASGNEPAPNIAVQCLAEMLADKQKRSVRGLSEMLSRFPEPVVVRNCLLSTSLFAACPIIPEIWLFLDALFQLAVVQFPEDFAFGADILRLLLVQLNSTGKFGREFLELLTDIGSAESEISEPDDLEEQLILEPCTEIWRLQLWQFLFTGSDTTVAARNGSSQVEQLRATVGRLMTQLAAQGAALKAANDRESSLRSAESIPLIVQRSERPIFFQPKIVSEEQKSSEAASPSKSFRVRNVADEEAAPRISASIRSSTSEIMDALRHSLSQRGERLEVLDNDASEMAAGSKSLAEMARELNAAQQAKKNRWGLPI